MLIILALQKKTDASQPPTILLKRLIVMCCNDRFCSTLKAKCCVNRIIYNNNLKIKFRARSLKIVNPIQVVVFKQEHAYSQRVAQAATMITSTACTYAFAAPIPKWNVLRGAAVYCFTLKVSQ